MNREELTYLAVLLGSIPVGFVLKERGRRWRQFGGALVGVGVSLLTCGPHALHSLLTVLGSWGLLTCLPRHSGGAVLLWVLGYLFFFRTPQLWGLPEPPPHANALQLLLTLKLASLASDTQELREAELTGVTSEETRLLIGSLRRVPSLIDILCYSYCYLGLLTGPFYRLGTHLDWVRCPGCPRARGRALRRLRWAPALGVLGVLVGRAWPAGAALHPEFAARPWAARLAHMVPVFLALRLRLYVGWLCAEAGCVAAGLGAYPKSARARPGQGPTVSWERPKTCADIPEDQWDFEAIRTVDPRGTELGRRFRDGLRRWNMTVQWWLAAYVHRRGPRRYPLIRNAWTMLVSAYWHGLHGGQYLSFLSVPLWLAAEAAAEAALGDYFGVPLERLGGWRGSALRGTQWFLKMRAFEYLSVGFVLRGAADTLRYWASVHFCLHVLPLLILLAAAAAGKGRHKGREGEKGQKEGQENGREGEKCREGEKSREGEKGREGENGRENGREKGREKGREGEKGEGEEKVRRRRERSEGEGGELLNPKIQGFGELMKPKIHEGWDPLKPKIQEGWDSHTKFEGGGQALNPKIQEFGDLMKPKIHEGWEPLNPKFEEGGEALNPKIHEGGDALKPKIHEGWDHLNPKIQECGEPLNPKIHEGEDLLNPKTHEGLDPLNPKFQEGGEPQNPQIYEGWNPQNPKSEAGELRKRRDPEGRAGDEPQEPNLG